MRPEKMRREGERGRQAEEGQWSQRARERESESGKGTRGASRLTRDQRLVHASKLVHEHAQHLSGVAPDLGSRGLGRPLGRGGRAVGRWRGRSEGRGEEGGEEGWEDLVELQGGGGGKTEGKERMFASEDARRKEETRESERT